MTGLTGEGEDQKDKCRSHEEDCWGTREIVSGHVGKVFLYVLQNKKEKGEHSSIPKRNV